MEGVMPARILVVDDDAISLRVVQRILAKYYQVETATSGSECLEIVRRVSLDLILLDIQMTGMDGFETLRLIREDKKSAELPVIFLTATDDAEVEARGLEAGAEDFIRKPFVPKIMLHRIRHVLEIYRLRYHLESEVSRQIEATVEKQKKLESFVEQTMLTLAHTIDAKDRYTSGHSARVALYSREIAKRAGRSEEEQRVIYFMGLLHDIGKIGVPDEILNKPGKLTNEEYAAIKKHPAVGYKILNNMESIHELSVGARWHHERYDGKGYPDGLSGKDIPDAARIIGVADAYDAMSSSRSYRNYLPQDVIRGELVKGRGTQFDPGYVDIMLAMMDEDKDYRMHEGSEMDAMPHSI